ncbi:hypothetical protein SAY87_027369 [Trapa incisa]|uniref:Uncharacterized protein n=1 Tax=Trapa incisa TaxID=236973 RepID=A0AAN7JMA9_9MYRT|nr:hypothetical protein SAY87_027369 [Trapa incisa]
MPQMDLEALVSCAGGSYDNKVACETLATEERQPEDGIVSGSDSDADPKLPEHSLPDFAPVSFWLSKDEEFDWMDRNALYERKESTKGNSSSSTNLHHPSSASTSTSQRFSLNRKSKASIIIGLPKPQKPSFAGPTNRRNAKSANTRLFPKPSGSTVKSAPRLVEPPSPKVSCMGRVRSKKKDRLRRQRSRQRSRSLDRTAPTASNAKAKPPGRKKAGLFSSFLCIFRSGKKAGTESEHHALRKGSASRSSSEPAVVPTTRDIRERLPPHELNAPPRRSVTEGEPHSLGTMSRFSSGRRSDAWFNDVA